MASNIYNQPYSEAINDISGASELYGESFASNKRVNFEKFVQLDFADFYRLMVLKLSKEKRETGHLTVHESAEENVTCFLWPTPYN